MEEAFENTSDIILLAIIECLKLPPLKMSQAILAAGDLGLAQAICILPLSTFNMKRALGLLVMATMRIANIPGYLLLAEKRSSHGFVSGLFSLLQKYFAIHREVCMSLEDEERENEAISVAFCALNVIQALLKESQNCGMVVTNPAFRHLFARLLSSESVNRSFLLVVLDALKICDIVIADIFGEKEIDMFVGSLLRRLEICTNLDADFSVELEEDGDLPPDYEVSSKVLPILATLSGRVGARSRNAGKLIAMCTKLSHSQELIGDNTSLALVIQAISQRFPKRLSKDKEFILGLFKLVRDPTCIDITGETLILLNRVSSLKEYGIQSGLYAGLRNMEKAEDTALAHFMAGAVDEAKENEVVERKNWSGEELSQSKCAIKREEEKKLAVKGI